MLDIPISDFSQLPQNSHVFLVYVLSGDYRQQHPLYKFGQFWKMITYTAFSFSVELISNSSEQSKH